ncbi:LOW QUALITY PROTEIN: TSNAXIP1 isoform 16, partial [Pongo abelii]
QLKQELGMELHEEVTLPKLRGALMTIDPSLDKQTVNTYVSQAFQLPESEMPEEGDEKEEGMVEILQTALERLQWGELSPKASRGKPNLTWRSQGSISQIPQKGTHVYSSAGRRSAGQARPLH